MSEFRALKPGDLVYVIDRGEVTAVHGDWAVVNGGEYLVWVNVIPEHQDHLRALYEQSADLDD
ncbi:hypothetical protein [Saccharothrix sp. HUAS TT1]|uniref:hypothetical protein n=1 Tax=unclassified Saccharothrix TaxID=2593673 RepID=UPI00345C609F